MAIELLYERMPAKEELRDAMALAESPVPSWGLGRAYASLQDVGYGQAAIAKAVGKSQGHVSMCVAVFRGLAPGAYEKVCRLGSAGPDLPGLVRIARCRKEEEPDEGAQVEAIDRLVRKRKIPRDFNLEQTVFRQFLKLREMRVPAEIDGVVGAVLGYLSGGPDPWPPTGTPPARPRRISRTRSTGSTGRRTGCGSSTKGESRRS